MGEHSKIAWTDHTFNPWTRCTKVSPACDHCYAETWAGRATHPRDSAGKPLSLWGPDAPRAPTSEHNWKQPIRWNRDAEASGKRARVFCASLADVFEDHPAIAASGARKRLWELIVATPWLDWLLLTKRPENMRCFAPEAWNERWPDNVWAGTTAEDQQRAGERIPHLLRVPARIRFLSVEPQLEAIGLEDWLTTIGSPQDMLPPERAISWIICGGESGHHARPFDLAWARSLHDQCIAAGVPFFMKQLGANPWDTTWPGHRLLLGDKAGADPDEWPADLRVRELPA